MLGGRHAFAIGILAACSFDTRWRKNQFEIPIFCSQVAMNILSQDKYARHFALHLLHKVFNSTVHLVQVLNKFMSGSRYE